MLKDVALRVLICPYGYPHPHHSLYPDWQISGAPTCKYNLNQIHFIHETGIGIIIGLIFGFIMYLTQDIKSVSFDE